MTATTDGVLLVTSQGGHLTQLLALEDWWGSGPRTWVAPDTADVRDRLAGEDWIVSFSPTTRNLANMVRNFTLARHVLHQRRPSVVVSTGAGVAFPFFVEAWALGVPTIYVEVYDRIDSATMTGRLCAPFTSRRLVQWDSQLEVYPDAHLIGPLL